MISIWNIRRWKNVPKQQIKKAGKKLIIFSMVLPLVACYPVAYREAPAPTAEKKAPITQVYFYPKENQSKEQQSRDQYECYNWAVNQTGFDPSQSSIPPERRVKVVPMPPPGHDTVALTIAGAVLGALIGGPRYAGAGALIGAGTGAVAGASIEASRQQYASQMDEAYRRGDQPLDAQYENKARDFRRAMSACLEGRGYSVQ